MKPLEISGGEVRGPALDVEHLIRLGMAFGGRHRKVLLGCWSDEVSAQARCNALEAGLLAAGAEVFSAGSLPRPALLFLARECGAEAVCSVLPDSVRFRGEDAGWTEDFRAENFCRTGHGGTRRAVLKSLNPYLRKLAQVADLEAIRRSCFGVHLQAEGAAEEWALKVLEKLHCRVTGPDQADVSFELSADGTEMRLAGYGPEMTVRMIFEHVLEAFPGDAVLSGKDAVTEEIIAGCGCEAYRVSGDETDLRNAMRQHGASLGGSVQSGKVIWKKFQQAPDGFLAMVLVLEMLSLSGQSLREIAESLRSV